MLRRVNWSVAALASCAIAPPTMAQADTAIEILLGEFNEEEGPEERALSIRFLNHSKAPVSINLPDRIAAIAKEQGRERSILLSRSVRGQAHATIAAGSFLRVDYLFPADARITQAAISIPDWSTQTVMFDSLPSAYLAGSHARPKGVVDEAAPPPPPPIDRKAGNAFVDNLDVYEPIYAVYGSGTNSAARVQLSFKYELFGTKAGQGGHWSDGLHLAYTQRMFWDVESKSSPFRNIDFQPELIYVTPSTTLADNIAVAIQAGIRHESNGRDGSQSRSINSIMISPLAAIPLAGGYRLNVAPRLSLYIGDKSDNPDIARYRGHAGLFMEVGEDNGLRLSTSTRFNFGAGKGAVNADLSYPLPRLLGGGPDLYLFAQSFHGYGENLLDYNRRATRLRFGLALVR